MYTNVRRLFHDRVCEWYYLWSHLQQLPVLTTHGLEMFLQVVILLVVLCLLVDFNDVVINQHDGSSVRDVALTERILQDNFDISAESFDVRLRSNTVRAVIG